MNKLIETIEALGGAIVGALLSVSIMVSAFLIVPDNLREPVMLTTVLSIAVLVLICILEPIYVFLLVTSLRDGVKSLAATMASRHPRVPLILSPVVSLYWLAHFLFAWAIVWGVHQYEREVNVLIVVELAALVFVLSYLAYGYLFLAVAVFTKKSRVFDFLLKRRVYCCILISTLSVFAPYVLPVTYEK
jgi:hypothetical protein